MSPETALRWFKALVILGVVANLALGAVGLADPGRVIALLGLEPASPPLWPRFASFLLILLSAFYVPGGLDPRRYGFNAWLAVICRFGGVAFFGIEGGRYLIFAAYDALFGVPQAILLWRARPALQETRA
jgi:hypothetical protein